ncbi:hypothetical protein WMY93_027747 [Mugilogobius chulae]|uniref:C-type lectin domain-containing protein n=1 Tax=Mugilogobius chulae TaxID=88201 RepID=A0AAW0N0M1_9GOBI
MQRSEPGRWQRYGAGSKKQPPPPSPPPQQHDTASRQRSITNRWPILASFVRSVTARHQTGTNEQWLFQGEQNCAAPFIYSMAPSCVRPDCPHPGIHCQIMKYHFINISLSWTEAQVYCRAHFTDLATVETRRTYRTCMYLMV